METQRSIKFIEVNDDETLSMGAEAMKVLSNLKTRKICVVLFAGTSGSGKSFLANQYINQNGFSLAHMQGYGTKGISMWSQPIPLSDSVDAIVLDCQGFNSNDFSPKLNQQLAHLQLLLASQVVMSTQGHISDQTLDSISVLESLNNEVDADLIWVLRDFILEFKTLTPNSYVNQCLDEVQKPSSEAAMTRNKVKTFLKEKFGKIQCFALARPVGQDQDVDCLDTGCALNPDFAAQAQQLVLNLKQTHKPKSICSLQLTGDLFMQLTLEFLDNLDDLNISLCVDHVLSVECGKVAEQVFEDVKDLPSEIAIQKAEEIILQKLSKLCSAKKLVELMSELEERIWSRTANEHDLSRNTCLQSIQNLVQQCDIRILLPKKVEDFQQIKGQMIKLKSEFSNCIQKFAQITEKEPYQAEAVCDLFNVHVLSEISNFESALNNIAGDAKSKAGKVLQEHKRQVQKLQEFVQAQQDQIKSYKSDLTIVNEEKMTQEAHVFEVQRQLQQVLDSTKSQATLSQMDIQNLKNSSQLMLHEKEAQQKQIACDIELQEEQVKKITDVLLKTQSQRLKEVTNLKNAALIAQDQLDQARKQYKSNSESIQVQQMYQGVKKEFDLLKAQLSEYYLARQVRKELEQVQTEASLASLSHSIKVELITRDSDRLDLELFKQQQEQISVVVQDQSRIRAELARETQDGIVLEAELLSQLEKTKNLQTLNQLLCESIAYHNLNIVHTNSFINTLKDRKDYDTNQREDLEVQYYTQTIQHAQLNEINETLLTFIEEFTKRVRQQFGFEVSGPVRDVFAFNSLESCEQTNVREILSQFGINY